MLHLSPGEAAVPAPRALRPAGPSLLRVAHGNVVLPGGDPPGHQRRRGGGVLRGLWRRHGGAESQPGLPQVGTSQPQNRPPEPRC